MKKSYMSPRTCIFPLQHRAHIAVSGGTYGITGYDGIDFGGIDLDGSTIPDVKVRKSIWDEEW